MKHFLQAGQAAVVSQGFDGLHRFAVHPRCQLNAGEMGFAIHQHGAGATFTTVATGFTARQLQYLAQIVQQQHIAGDQVFPLLAVYGHSNNGFVSARHFTPPTGTHTPWGCNSPESQSWPIGLSVSSSQVSSSSGCLASQSSSKWTCSRSSSAISSARVRRASESA